MQRLDFKIPLLIGGATTSKAHTAVKIEQHYVNDSTIYVPDASRSVSVVSTLLNGKNKPEYASKIRSEYEVIRERVANRSTKLKLLPYKKANANPFTADWNNFTAARPAFLGTKVFIDYSLEDLIDYIDWTPFFITWSLAGKYPAILDDEKVGEAATDLFADAQALLKKIVDEKLLTAKAVIGFWPANKIADNDVQLYATDESRAPLNKLHFLRQQIPKEAELPNLCLADFIAPKSAENGTDYIGGFAVTTGIGADELATKYSAENDDYTAIMVKALADRLAEAFAEHMHERVRKEFWGFDPTEEFSATELISEKYRGIRPAPGYPACPDHSEKQTLFSLLNAAEEIQIELTESFAMNPAASVSGFYFGHPDSKYFSVGKITQEQVDDLSNRNGKTAAEMTKLLNPNLE
jgi:5-methyltetrahydrofolate--homocysteine methyltransferase